MVPRSLWLQCLTVASVLRPRRDRSGSRSISYLRCQSWEWRAHSLNGRSGGRGRGCDPGGMPYDARLNAYSNIPLKSEKGANMRLLALSLAAATLLCVATILETSAAAYERYAQYYPPPPPGYGYVPPCQAVTRGPFRGAARGAAGGALVGAIGGNAGKGAAIGAGVGAVAGAVRRGSGRRPR